MSDLTREQILQRAAVLLRAFSEYGMEAKFSNGYRTPNSIQAEETASMLDKLAISHSPATDEREGFYEKLWRDFVSLQRGDAQAICEKVERYYREQPFPATGAVSVPRDLLRFVERALAAYGQAEYYRQDLAKLLAASPSEGGRE